MAQTAIKTRPRQIDFSHILVIGAWGFAIVIASMLFLYVGHLIDEMLHGADGARARYRHRLSPGVPRCSPTTCGLRCVASGGTPA